MDVEEKFVYMASLICEPARARMLWNLLDGRSYTATELAAAADVSPTSASNHLSKLLEAELLKVEIQGRHRYYSFANAETAYTVESLASLSGRDAKSNKSIEPPGIKKCRSCYDHLAGFIGVEITDALERKSYLQKDESVYLVTGKGWEWFAGIEIFADDFAGSRRPLTRQCLDWSERRPHLAGHLGAALLEKSLRRKWFEKVQFSRELIITAGGKKWLNDSLNIVCS